jgi:hypothetical protein
MTSLCSLLGDGCCHTVVLKSLNSPTVSECCQSVVMTSLNSLLGNSCCQALFLMSLNSPTVSECLSVSARE